MKGPRYRLSGALRLLSDVAYTRHDGVFRLDKVLHVALQLELVVARLRRRRRQRRQRLVRRDPHVAVVQEALPAVIESDAFVIPRGSGVVRSRAIGGTCQSWC